MSYSGQASVGDGRETATSRPDCDPQAVLELLADEYAQQVIDCTDRPRTVGELAEHCGLPRSTAYRKISRLTEAGLLEQSVRVTATGEHPAEYERTIAGISIALDDGIDVDCR